MTSDYLGWCERRTSECTDAVPWIASSRLHTCVFTPASSHLRLHTCVFTLLLTQSRLQTSLEEDDFERFREQSGQELLTACLQLLRTEFIGTLRARLESPAGGGWRTTAVAAARACVLGHARVACRAQDNA